MIKKFQKKCQWFCFELLRPLPEFTVQRSLIRISEFTHEIGFAFFLKYSFFQLFCLHSSLSLSSLSSFLFFVFFFSSSFSYFLPFCLFPFCLFHFSHLLVLHFLFMFFVFSLTSSSST